MRCLDSFIIPAISQPLLSGQLVVLPTDTIYGLVAQAADPAAVQRLYTVRRRPAHKPSIVLVDSSAAIPGLDQSQRQLYDQLNTQRPTTLIQLVPGQLLPHLARQQGTLAFRAVTTPSLQRLLRRTGPIIAPSANLEGLPPATDLDQAIAYFGEQVALYVTDNKTPEHTASRIVRFEQGQVITIRQ